ncbi:unnamed protein product [Tilletia controversa]|nr:unnamed protein product [Tilletia controversa]CAD6912276.1 unnamed protein product [Tilletia controversa]
MPTLFSRRPTKANGGRGGGAASPHNGTISNSNHWAGISSTDFPRLDSPSSDDARPLPPMINSLPVERSVSHGNPRGGAPTTTTAGGSVGSSFLAPQRNNDSSAHLLLLNAGNHSALGMSNAGSASSATRLHALLAAEHAEPSHSVQYGYTPVPEGVSEFQLELHGVEQVVLICGREIKARGIDVPLIFSSMALDLSSTNVKSLIANLLNPEFYHSQATSTTAAQIQFGQSFINEVRFANPHDLAALIKWSLTRLGRVFEVPVPVQANKGKVQEEVIFMQQRGFIDLDIYMAWRDEERRSHYALTAFDVFLKSISPPAASLLLALFALLSSVTAYSLKNGMTPSKISRLFGVLLFGLPEDESFARTYDAFARASNATEHLFLSYIRYLSASSSLPTRLTESVMGYPGMLAPELTAPGKQARGVPLTQIERTVRLYSVDLLQSASEIELVDECVEWRACQRRRNAREPPAPGGNSAGGNNGAENALTEPQLSEKYRKLINLRGQAIRKKAGSGGSRAGGGRAGSESGVGGGGGGGKNGSGGGTGTTGRAKNAGKIALSEMDAVTVESYGSLVSEQWGDFMSDGFSGTDASKLTFDLRESQRKVRTQAPENRQWSDFATAGFTVNDYGLDNVLNFDDGLKEEMERWPGERAELNERLRQTQKRLPHFPYDTTPRVVASPTQAALDGESAPGQGQQHMHPISRMDETFPEVWADYLVGCGWSNRDELTHRNANFAVVQYKSRPIESAVGVQAAAQRSLLSLLSPNSTNGHAKNGTNAGSTSSSSSSSESGADDRTDAAWFVVEEVVPAQYRAELEAVGRRKGSSKPMIRKLNLFKKLAAVARERRDKVSSPPAPVFSSSSAGSAGPTFGAGAGAGVGGYYDGDDVFRPGPGGSTRVLRLNDPAGGYAGAGSATGDYTYSTIGSSSTNRTSEDSGLAAFNMSSAGDTSAGSRILSTLRGARSRRTAAAALGGGVRRDSNSTPPPPPPKDSRDGLTTPTPGDGGGGRRRSASPNVGGAGFLQARQRADSLNSADIETRSFLDPDAELEHGGGGSWSGAGLKNAVGGALWRRNPLSRHHYKKSKDDAWVDIMMKDPSSSSSSSGNGASGSAGAAAPTPAAALAASVGLGLREEPFVISPTVRAAPEASMEAEEDQEEEEDDDDLADAGRRTPTAARRRSPEEYDRAGGATTPTQTFDAQLRRAGGSSSSSSAVPAALDGLAPSSSTPSRARGGLPADSGVGLGFPVIDEPEEGGPSSSFVGSGSGSRVLLGVEGSSASGREELTRSPTSPARNGLPVSPSSPSASVDTNGGGVFGGGGLAPPSPNMNSKRSSDVSDVSSVSSFSTSETDLNSRIAQEAAAAAQGRTAGSSGILSPWEVEAQRKRLEQERIQESLRLARSLRDKLRTVEARELRGGGGSSSSASAAGGSGSAGNSTDTDSLRIVTGGVAAAAAAAAAAATAPAMTPSSSGTGTSAVTTANGGQTMSPSSSTTGAGLATTPTRPVIDPFAKNRTAGRVADIASRFGGPSRAGGAAGGTPGRSASGSESARSPMSPLSPQGTGGSEYGYGGVIGAAGGSAAAAAASSGAPPTVPSKLSSSAESEAPSRSSLENGHYTDNDSIYPDDAASNFSRETSATDDDAQSLREQQRNWNFTAALKKQNAAAAAGIASGVGAAGISSSSSTDGGALASTFPGDAGRSEDEDESMPMPSYVFREPYQPGMPLDNVTEETESVISGSNVH